MLQSATIQDEATSEGTLPAAATTPRLLGGLESLRLPAPVVLKRFRTIVGRRNADVCVEDPDISRQHAVIERYDQRYLIRDLGSTNGTWVNGRRIEVEILCPGDVVQLGGTRFLFRLELG